MRKFSKKIAFVAAIAGAATTVHANDRYATPPPVKLSPNLTKPWVMQLQPQRQIAVPRVQTAERRVVVRRERQPLRRIVSQEQLKQQQLARLQQQQQRAKPATRGLDPMYLPQMVSYNGKASPGTIVISTRDRFLYLVMEGNRAMRYGVGVGKAGFEWRGTKNITRKAEWPSWRPPQSMIQRVKREQGRTLPSYMAGGPDNPLGARALYLGTSLYRIHGTNQPWTIGQAVSSGCIRMRNEDVTDLYTRVGVGTRVVVL
ncbi:MAG: L,D-transpeptidase [Pseudomonadota bacterium]